ncbi:transposase [Streptomyces sp. SID486]|uniref:transposase n=1 Tax=Streptomyces sp. SID486 TaxID=2690264 RepID=UPI001F42D5FD|nr:transposase [Streptomyces sp. SID486]
MRGRPAVGRRKLIDGIRWRVRTGAPWRDLPSEYGPWQTVYGLFRRWQRDGTWPELLTRLGPGGRGRAGVVDLGRRGQPAQPHRPGRPPYPPHGDTL